MMEYLPGESDTTCIYSKNVIQQIGGENLVTLNPLGKKKKLRFRTVDVSTVK